MLTRGMNLVATTISKKPEKAIICGDSECSIAALDKSSGVLCPSFANRVSEVHENIRHLREILDDVNPVYHVAGELNPADLGTRGHATVDEVNRNSIW